MAQWIYGLANSNVSSNDYTAATTYYNGLSGSTYGTVLTEARTIAMLRDSYTVNDGYVRITSNTVDNATSFNFRDDGVNSGPSVSVTGDTTGVFTNNTSGSIASGSRCNWQIVVGTSGMANDTLRASVVSCTLSSTNNSPAFQTFSVPTSVARNLTRYYPFTGAIEKLTGGSGNATEANVDYLIKYGITFSNLCVQVTVNTIETTDSTFALRDDGVTTSLSVTITKSTTGEFEDVTNSAVVANPSRVNYILTTGDSTKSTHTVDIQSMSMKGSGTSKTVALGSSNTGNALGSFFGMIDGSSANNEGWATGTEANTKQSARFSFTANNGFISVSANDTTTADVILRKNGANTSLDISITGTGEFQDTTNSVSYISTDDINWSFVFTGGTAFGFLVLGFELTNPVNIPTANDTSSFIFTSS